MLKFDHLVVPTDFSPIAENALQFAAEIAKKKESTIHLIHVYERPYMDAARNGVITAMVDSAKEHEFKAEIQAEVEKLAKKDFLRGLKVFRKLVVDKSSWRFYEDIDEGKGDLIVMGTRGYTDFMTDTFIGTNTERVIRYAPIPVLSVPDGAVYNGIKKIMLATDFIDDYESLASGVVEFAKVFDAEIDVVMINTRSNYNTSNFATEEFHKLAEKHPYPKMKLYVHNAETVEDGIRDLTFSNNIDVISMLTHGRTGLQHLLVGSIAESVSTHIRCPLLTFKNK
jgi:nucleotide-binding universal stress UspA family protein